MIDKNPKHRLSDPLPKPVVAQDYVGRFAPTPSGDLHFGSLVTAIASFLDARSHGGKWLLRIEDLDPLREITGAAQSILQTLDAHRLHWDDQVSYQSHHRDLYEHYTKQLLSQQIAFHCSCSRNQLRKKYRGIYPGLCRHKNHHKNGSFQPQTPLSIRLMVNNNPMAFTDAVQGRFMQKLQNDVGDFIIKRKDGFHAYHLAVVIDDQKQGITRIVRGTDLLDNTPRQIYLQQLLGFNTPQYLHLPVITNDQGQKLSKQTLAAIVPVERASDNLFAALVALNHQPPKEYKSAPPDELVSWGITNWNRDLIPKQDTIPASTCGIL